HDTPDVGRPGLASDQKPATAPKRALPLALSIALRDCFALVIRLLAARECNLQLCFAAFQVQPQGNESRPRRLDLMLELADLSAMQEQSARTRRVVVVAACRRVVGYMGAHKPHLALLG